MIDLRKMSSCVATRTQRQVPRNCSLLPEPFFASDVTAQGILDGNALQEAGRFNQRIKVELLGHGDCDGGRRRKDKFGNKIGGDEAVGILIHLVAQCSCQ